MNLFDFKKKLSKEIFFTPWIEEIEFMEITPVPSSSEMPNWYKKLPRFINNSDKPIKALAKKDLKTCSPFRDVMLIGYMYRTPADMEVISYENGDVDIFWNPHLPFKAVEKRGSVLDINNQGFGMPVPVGCNPIMFAFTPTYGSGVNDNYSVLITHPLNRFELPFVTTSGLLDPIGLGTEGGNVPFFIKQGFSGVIPKGTPYAQIIPIKQENWIHKINQYIPKQYMRKVALRDSVFLGWYDKSVRKIRTNRTYK